MFEIAVVVATKHALSHPKFASLFLRERVRSILHAQRLHSGARVRARQVIALSTAAVVENFVAPVGVFKRPQFRRDFADGGVPTDGLVGSIGLAAHRR